MTVRHAALGLLLVTSACGRIGFDARSDGSSNGSMDSSSLVVGLPPPQCATGATSISMRDDFTDSTATLAMWKAVPTDATFEESGSLVTFTPTSAAGMTTFSYLETSSFFSVFGGIKESYAIEIAGMVPTTPTTNSFAYFGITGGLPDPAAGIYVIRQQRGMLTRVSSGVSIPYDPIAQRFWQVRDIGGTVVFETSPDGMNWVMFDSEPSAPSFVRAFFGVGTTDTESAPGTASFDSITYYSCG